MGMRFAIVPLEDLKRIDPDWEERRRNVDGTEALIHYELLMELKAKNLPSNLRYRRAIKLPYPVLEGEELDELLTSPAW